jgi:S1-C subfamily serine protease
MKNRRAIPRAVSRIESAIVRLPGQGQGVLVPGEYVLTAAHCLGWRGEERIALGEDPEFYEQIVAADGRTITLSPYAIDSVSDLAVLGAVDGGASPNFLEAFFAFCADTVPVPIALDEFVVRVARNVFLFTHNKGIIPARATLGRPDAYTLVLETDESVDGGTSGGPVVTREGKLLGILSNAGGPPGGPQCQCRILRIHLAAPVWLIRQMIPQANRRGLDNSLPPGRYAKRFLDKERRQVRSAIRMLEKESREAKHKG